MMEVKNPLVKQMTQNFLHFYGPPMRLRGCPATLYYISKMVADTITDF